MRATRLKLGALLFCCAAALCVAVAAGSVAIAPGDLFAILAHRLFGRPLPASLEGSTLPGILWDIRLPRALCAFCVGGALSASGTVMQSVLQNPLASSYTLGVSAGASLGAALVICTGLSLPLLGALTLPAAGCVFGLGTVLGAIAFARRIDRGLQDQTIVLVGMVFSLFANAILTLLSTFFQNYAQQMLLWQMGSFSGRSWQQTGIVAAVTVVGTAALCCYSRELDMMTFGEESARAMGVETGRVKLILIVLGSLLTGAAVCFTGTIGFVDLIAPHVVRRIFGPRHRLLVPLSVLFGGAALALADTAARTLLAPRELPVGAVTALIGAPFFAWVFFKGRRRA